MPNGPAQALPPVVSCVLSQGTVLPPISRLLVTLASAVARWELRQKTRRDLARLDRRLLQDVGLDHLCAGDDTPKPVDWT